MSTRSNFYPFNSTATIPRRSNRRRVLNIVEPEIRTIEEIVLMADRTMEELLQAPTEGYEDAIVISEILMENFEIKTNLLQFEETFGEACDRFKEMLRACPHHEFSELTQIDTFYNGLTEQDQDSLNAAAGGNLLNKTTREALKIFENKSKVRYSKSKSNVYRVNTNSRDNVSKTDDRIDKLADQIYNLVEIVNKQVIAPAKAVEKTCVTCGGAHAYYDCITTDSNQPSVCAETGSYNQVSPPNRASHQIPPPGFAPVQNNPNRYNQGQGNYFNQANNFNQGNNFNRANNFQNNQGYRAQMNNAPHFQNQGFQNQPFSVPNNQIQLGVLNEFLSYMKSNEIMIKSMQNQINVLRGDFNKQEEILRRNLNNDMRIVPISILEPDVLRIQSKPTIPYPSSFADALLLMPKFASTIKSLLVNKDKLFELAKVPLNENCSAMLLKKLPKNLGDPGKFLIPCDFPGMEVCHALADLGASINIMPLLIWKKLSLPELTPTRMTLELADRSITHPKEVAKDVFVKVGKFHFPTDFVVVDFEADPRVPLILGRSFLRTGHALIDVYGEEITLRYNPKSSSPTLVFDSSVPENDVSKEPIVKSSSPTLTPFGESDFFLEEIEDFLNDDSIPAGIENFVYDPEGDILFLEKLLNEDPFQLPSMDFKLAKESKAKSSVEEPPELELKELPSHLEYAFLEESNKLPKISDIKGIDPRFCTYKMLMEDDYKPAVQSQIRVNPKIYDVIKKEVIKLLDAGMIYPISNSPWVSPIHYVPKKGGMTVVANENNELIPTRLVTGWRVCIDYRKLNDATRKDYFPPPFMDQMLERLAGNKFYYFLDGFSRYFQIPIDPQDQEKTTFTCPYGTFAYRRMPFGLCNAPGTFQRCMMSIFHDMIEKTIEGIVLGHKISKSGIEVDRAKVDVIAKLPHPTTVKGVRSFLGHAEAPILVVPDWNLPFELMCDASDFAAGVVLGQRKTKHFQPIYYASKTMTEAQIHYTTTEKEMIAVVYAFEKFRSYLVLSKSIVYTDHSALKYLLNKQDAKPRLENPHKDVLENKDINENFLLETLGSLSSNSTLWFADIVNFHAGNFIKKGLTSQQNKKFFKDLLKSSKLAMRDLLGAIMVPISQRRRDKEKSLNEMRCLRTLSKFVRYSIYEAYENYVIYKERTKKLHDSKIKNPIFNVGDQVLLFNSRLKIFFVKLKTRWSCPFTITQVFPYGTIELSQPNGPNFKVNGHRVKHYFGGDIPSDIASDLHTFSMDN
nr:DNA-directed DNA polymerase [Tanacetum cinerariifolium]